MTRRILATFVLLACANANGDPIQIGDTEWADFADLGRLTWSSIARVCNSETGECSGELNGYDVTGWNWAGFDEVLSLLNGLLDTNSNLLDIFTATNTGSSSSAPYAGGHTRTEYSIQPGTYLYVLAYSNDIGTGAVFPNNTCCSLSAWLYRSSGGSQSVPEPSTLALLGIGLAGIGFARRRKKA